MKAQTRLERLDRLESWLKSDELLILRDAATELGVSIRTISRDIDLLRERGVPVEADRGRGGGVRLHSQWGVGRVSFTYKEAIDLLVGMAMSEQADQSMQMGQSRSIRRKLMASFAHSDQARINKFRDRIRTGPGSSSTSVNTFAPATQQVTAHLKEAFLLQKTAQIIYRDAQDQETTRTIEIHYLILNPPIWYAMCWDHLRQDIRSFRCDRMHQATLQRENFELLPWSDFQTAMEGNLTHKI
jgi:predicted DNA-binding transcriptional regulator YafY